MLTFGIRSTDFGGLETVTTSGSPFIVLSRMGDLGERLSIEQSIQY